MLKRKDIMIKVAITGHSKNIGKYIFDSVSPNVIGFSRSNGYDITKKEDRKRIIKESADCDVFINNAPAKFGQSELCLELWHEWKDTKKVIVNVGSRIAEEHIVLNQDYLHLLEYSMHKRTLKTLSEDLNKINTLVKVNYCWFSYVGTPEILAKYPHFTENDYISIEQAGKIILNESFY
jgi:hypothetical protein